MRTTLAIAGALAALAGGLGCGGDVLGSASAPDAALASPDANTTKSSPQTCHWPATLNDGGPSGCTVGRVFLECDYPHGVLCKDGFGAISSPGVTQQCISDNSESCSDCMSAGGTPTCRSLCVPDEYVVNCYGNPPPGCSQVDGSAGYTCCPCL